MHENLYKWIEFLVMTWMRQIYTAIESMQTYRDIQ